MAASARRNARKGPTEPTPEDQWRGASGRDEAKRAGWGVTVNRLKSALSLIGCVRLMSKLFATYLRGRRRSKAAPLAKHSGVCGVVVATHCQLANFLLVFPRPKSKTEVSLSPFRSLPLFPESPGASGCFRKWLPGGSRMGSTVVSVVNVGQYPQKSYCSFS